MSNFSFSHNVFKSCLLLMRQNEYLWSKGLSSHSMAGSIFLQISTEDSDSSVVGAFEGEVPRYPPIMTQDELLLCYWKISVRLID